MAMSVQGIDLKNEIRAFSLIMQGKQMKERRMEWSNVQNRVAVVLRNLSSNPSKAKR